MLARAKPKAKPKSALDQVLKLGQEKSSKRGKGKKHHKCEAAVKLGGVLFSGDEDGGESNEDKDDKKTTFWTAILRINTRTIHIHIDKCTAQPAFISIILTAHC